jgi:hypothetical protein
MASQTSFRSAGMGRPSDPARRQNRRVQRIKNLRVHEASVVARPANPHALILIRKHKGEGEMLEEIRQIENTGRFDKREIAEGMEALALELVPDAETAAEALLAAWRHPDMVEMYRAHEKAPAAEPDEPITKSAEPGNETWQKIRKRAKALLAESGAHLTMAEAIDQVTTPELYARYLEEVSTEDDE